jgi:hypothetical protein
MMHGRWGVEWVAFGVLVVSQSACTSLVPLDAADAAGILAAIDAGDRLSVLDSQGATTELEVTAVGADFVEGRSANGEPVRIAAAEMHEIRERRNAPGKAIALGAGVTMLLFMQAASEWGSVGW